MIPKLIAMLMKGCIKHQEALQIVAESEFTHDYDVGKVLSFEQRECYHGCDGLDVNCPNHYPSGLYLNDKFHVGKFVQLMTENVKCIGNT